MPAGNASDALASDIYSHSIYIYFNKIFRRSLGDFATRIGDNLRKVEWIYAGCGRRMVRIVPRVQHSAASTAITAARRLKASDSHITGAGSGTCSGSLKKKKNHVFYPQQQHRCCHLYVWMKRFSPQVRPGRCIFASLPNGSTSSRRGV